MPKQIFNPESKYQTIKNAARISGASSKWIRAKVKEGKIKAFMVGSEYRVDMSALWKYLDTISNTVES